MVKRNSDSKPPSARDTAIAREATAAYPSRRKAVDGPPKTRKSTPVEPLQAV